MSCCYIIFDTTHLIIFRKYPSNTGSPLPPCHFRTSMPDLLPVLTEENVHEKVKNKSLQRSRSSDDATFAKKHDKLQVERILDTYPYAQRNSKINFKGINKEIEDLVFAYRTSNPEKSQFSEEQYKTKKYEEILKRINEVTKVEINTLNDYDKVVDVIRLQSKSLRNPSNHTKHMCPKCKKEMIVCTHSSNKDDTQNKSSVKTFFTRRIKSESITKASSVENINPLDVYLYTQRKSTTSKK